ncbi:hypothetical protein Tco_1397051 [Tanacetum coccineum]
MRDGCNSCGGPHPSSECDEKRLGGPKEEANYIHKGYREGGYRGNYYGRNSRNWRDRQSRDDNCHTQPHDDDCPTPPTPDKKLDETDSEKTMRELIPYRPPPARNEHVNDVFIRSGKTYDPPVNLNDKPTIIRDDSDDEADEAKKVDQPSLKAYKPKIPYPQHMRKEKTEECFAKFIDMIKEVRINVPFIDVW